MPQSSLRYNGRLICDVSDYDDMGGYVLNKKAKSQLRIISLLVVSIIIGGCATIKQFDYTTMQGAPAIVTGSFDADGLWGDKNAFRVVGVNGHRPSYGWRGNLFDSQVLLSKGSHKLLVKYEGNISGREKVGYYDIEVDLLEGETYIVVGKGTDDLVRIWVENTDGGKRASKEFRFTSSNVVTIPVFVPM